MDIIRRWVCALGCMFIGPGFVQASMLECNDNLSNGKWESVQRNVLEIEAPRLNAYGIRVDGFVDKRDDMEMCRTTLEFKDGKVIETEICNIHQSRSVSRRIQGGYKLVDPDTISIYSEFMEQDLLYTCLYDDATETLYLLPQQQTFSYWYELALLFYDAYRKIPSR